MSSTASAVLKPGAPGLIYAHVAPAAAVAIACVASFMVVMDGAIVNVALPAIQADLGLSTVALQWVVDAYLLMLGGFMLLAARAGDLFGRKRVLQYGLLIFTLASLAGGMATSGPLLLAARALQGFGASALATSTLAVIVAVHPTGTGRARAISMWAASSSIASALGVVIGGVLTTQVNWRWVMYVNVPIGAGLMAAVALCLAPSRPNAQNPSLDIPGAAAITLGMGALMVGVSQSVSHGWGSPMVMGALAAAVVLIGAFFAMQSRVQNPLVRPSIWRVHNVRMGNVVVLCLGASLTASTFFTSMVLQGIAGYNALDTGLAMLPMGLTLALAAIVSRPLMDGGVRRLPFLGGLISAVGLLWMATIPAQPVWLVHVLGPTLLMGLGLGLMLMTATHTAMDGVPPQDAGLASGLFNTARQLGAALGIAGLVTLARSLAAHGGQVGPSASLALLHGYHGVFVATAVLSVVAALASWTLRRVA